MCFEKNKCEFSFIFYFCKEITTLFVCELNKSVDVNKIKTDENVICEIKRNMPTTHSI